MTTQQIDLGGCAVRCDVSNSREFFKSREWSADEETAIAEVASKMVVDGKLPKIFTIGHFAINSGRSRSFNFDARIGDCKRTHVCEWRIASVAEAIYCQSRHEEAVVILHDDHPIAVALQPVIEVWRADYDSEKAAAKATDGWTV